MMHPEDSKQDLGVIHLVVVSEIQRAIDFLLCIMFSNGLMPNGISGFVSLCQISSSVF